MGQAFCFVSVGLEHGAATSPSPSILGIPLCRWADLRGVLRPLWCSGSLSCRFSFMEFFLKPRLFPLHLWWMQGRPKQVLRPQLLREHLPLRTIQPKPVQPAFVLVLLLGIVDLLLL